MTFSEVYLHLELLLLSMNAFYTDIPDISAFTMISVIKLRRSFPMLRTVSSQ